MILGPLVPWADMDIHKISMEFMVAGTAVGVEFDLSRKPWQAMEQF
jgi:hypothetical protein